MNLSHKLRKRDTMENITSSNVVSDEIKKLNVPQHKLSAFVSDFYNRHRELRESNFPAYLSLLLINVYHAGMKEGETH